MIPPLSTTASTAPTSPTRADLRRGPRQRHEALAAPAPWAAAPGAKTSGGADGHGAAYPGDRSYHRHVALIGRTVLAVSLFVASGVVPGLVPAVHAAEPGEEGPTLSWPLRFDQLDFAAACFDTRRCKVRYDGAEFGDPEPTPSKATLSPEAYDDALSANHGPVPRAAPAAQVDWISKDGSALRARVDIATIFRDGLVRHHVPRQDIAEGGSIGGTAVLLEVDDRRLNVYTRTLIPLKAPRDPDDPDSEFRDELIKVYSQTY